MRWLLVFLAVAPGMIHIRAGSLVVGSDGDEPDERPAHRVQIAAFDLDRDEVTVADYARCVAAGKCRAPRRSASYPGASVDDPVTWVSWDDAQAYCRFAGKRLPSEAEWERAARGEGGRRYPWGEAADCARANFGNYRGEGRCPDNPGHPVPPGRYPGGTSQDGARDLAGNVWEWVADRYDPRYYAHGPSRNPRGPRAALGGKRVLRGGACCSMFGLPRASNRLALPASYADEDIGFRCACDAK